MFKKNDPLVHSVKAIMEQNELHRRVEAKLCEELGIYSRKALPREHQANYDALLEQRLEEAKKDSLAAYERRMSKGPEASKEEGNWSKKMNKQQADYGKMREKMVGKGTDKETTRKLVGEELDEELKGNQHKIDANKNNKVDAHDFKLLRAKKSMQEEDDGEETREGGAVTRDGKPVVSPTATRAGESSARRPASEGPSASDRQALTNKIKGLVKEEDQDIHSNQPTNLNKLKSDVTSAAPNDSAKTSSPDESPIVNKPAKSFMETSHKKLYEKKLTDAEMSKREEIVKSMKKGAKGFKSRYGERAKEAMYATATKQAKKLAEETVDLDAVMEEIARNLGKDNLNKIINKD